MNHLKQILEKLDDYGIDALLITGEAGEAYAVDFQGEGVVLAAKSGCHYFTDSRYLESAERQVAGCRVACVSRAKSHRVLTAEAVDLQGIRRLGIQEDSMTLQSWEAWKQALGAQVELVPAGKLLLELRAVKDGEELARMEAAQAITDRTFTEILNHIRPGVPEREIAAKITYYQMKFGARKNSFDPIVVSGPNGSLPHGIPGDRTFRPGDFVTMDFGCTVEGYCSDMTRTVAVGAPSEEMERVYHTVLEAQLAGISAARAGVLGSDLHQVAQDIIARAGYGAYFGHGLGHSLGLEIHENPNFAPSWKKAIPAGAVLSVEPGIYLPGRFGVRIEDVVCLEEGGCRVLTRSPKELIVL